MSSLLRFLRYVFLLLLVVMSTVAMTLVFYLHGSFPQLDGTLIVPGLRAKVELERDAQGIPTLSAIHREDIAYGLGFLHAQERFF
ncbi:MAG: penicillin acylase family protein, partial [Natronospirillum sp.]